MDQRETEIEGALVGALSALAANWVQGDNRTQRQLTAAREDARDAVTALRNLWSSGYYQRIIRPVVCDALGGLLLAERRPDQPSITPSLRQLHRINLAHGMREHLEHLRFPPREGEYDDQGLVRRPGDLTTLFLGLTYGESQCWNLGLLQEENPSQAQKQQIYYAAHALTKVLYSTDLTLDDFLEAWKRLFLGQDSTATDPHHNAATPPTVVGINPDIVSVLPLGSEAIGAYPFKSQNTDTANKWRITVGAAGVPAAQVLFQVTFSTPYKRDNLPYAPVVLAQGLGMSATALTNTNFNVQSIFALTPNTIIDVSFAVVEG